ncbi:MAG TPA: hypothetical protein VN903_36510 [Polyangia bacterium]|nr:hypothetical protein [Polyangia bacterium]
MITFNLKVRAQELVDVNTKLEKGTVQVTERLKLTLTGQSGDKKTKFVLLCDPELRTEYALKKIVRVQLDIPQGELALDAPQPAKPKGNGDANATKKRDRRGAADIAHAGLQ